MSNEKYIFNPSTLQYEKEDKSAKSKIYTGIRYLSGVVFSSVIIFSLAYYFFPTPKEKALEREISQMEFYYNDLTKQFESLTTEIDQLQQKDADVHRVIFGMDPVDENVWNGGIGGREPIALLSNNQSANELLEEALSKLDKLKRKVELQNNSMDTLLKVASEHENKLSSIPSIKPIQEDKLKRKVSHMSGYGMRIHPVHKVRKMHHGIDFTAPRGTSIQATGNGVVVKVEKRRTGYGTSVVIDHGYGYETLYGHMSEVVVNKGDKVSKGQKIGLVGSTGTSTAPHCHYEVRINGQTVNPIDFVLDGLTPSEYHELVSKASEENQSLD